MRMPLCIITLLYCCLCNAQTAIFQFNHRGRIVAGVHADFHINVTGASCSKVSVTASDCDVHENGDCSFSYRASKPGDVTFTAWLKTPKGPKKIGEHKMQVGRYPAPVVTLGHYMNDTVQAAMVRLQYYPAISFHCYERVYNPSFDVYKYTVVVIRNGEVVFQKQHYNENRKAIIFDKETRDFMSTFRAGDDLLIKDIAAHGAGSDYTDLNEIKIHAAN